MKKALIIAATMIALTGVSYSKELNLECVYIGVSESKRMTTPVMINTTTNQMSIGNQTGALITSTDYYSSKIHDALGGQVIKVNRHDLSWTLHIGMTGRDMLTAGCKLVENKSKI